MGNQWARYIKLHNSVVILRYLYSDGMIGDYRVRPHCPESYPCSSVLIGFSKARRYAETLLVHNYLLNLSETV